MTKYLPGRKTETNRTAAPILLTLLVLVAHDADAWGQPLAFERVEVDPKPPNNPWIKIVADLDGDGRKDIAIGGSAGPLVWYRNPDWSKAEVVKGGYSSVDGEAGDVDGDGDLDIIMGGIVWYENPMPRQPPADAPWAVHRIGTHRTHDLELADLDRDGKLDVVVRGQTRFGPKEGHRVLLWKQQAPDRWASRELSCPEGEGLEVADIDGDGDPDVVIGTRWFENDGDLLRGSWAEHVYTTEWMHGDAKVAVGDINGDGRPDVVLTPAELRGGRYQVAWYEAPPVPRAGSWRQHVVEPEVETVVHALAVGDLSGDGLIDIVTARMHQGQSPQDVCVYHNGGAGRKWVKQVVSTKGSHNIELADLEGDGDLDILGANHGGNYQPIELWRNDGRKKGGR